MPWFFRPLALFQRELPKKEKDKRRLEFQEYLQQVLDCGLVRENFELIFNFLQLPMCVYKNWYLYRETDSDNYEILVKFQKQQFKEMKEFLKSRAPPAGIKGAAANG